jgi:hypothetical protein
MTAKARNSFSTTAPSEVSRRPVRSFRSLRWLNGSVHWISAGVLVYAFISNGETTGALINPLAMSGEVKLGLVVGLIFLIRFTWVRSMRSGGGRWVGPSVRMPQSKIRRITDWGIYLGVAASVVSGLLIAYLRPGAELISQSRGFSTSSPALKRSRVRLRRVGMAVRFPRRVRTLALGDKKNAMGQDCRGLAGGSRGCRKPRRHVATRSKKLSPLGPPGTQHVKLTQ